MKIYSRASDDVLIHIRNMQSRNHPDLYEVTVDALFVFDDEKSSMPVLKHQGYGAAAVVRITPLRDRALGTADAVIVVDRATWVDLTAPQRNALTDHELTHLNWAKDNEGHPRSDGLGRPKLVMRRHSLQIGFFTEILERHGDASFEAKQAREMLAIVGQAQFDFGGAGVDRATGELHSKLRDAFNGKDVTITISGIEAGGSKEAPLPAVNFTSKYPGSWEANGGPNETTLFDDHRADAKSQPAPSGEAAEASADSTDDLSAENGMDAELESDIARLEDQARQSQADFAAVSEHGEAA